MATENLHLSLSMPQIKKERKAAAAIARLMRPLSRHMRRKALRMAAISLEQEPVTVEKSLTSQPTGDTE